METCHYPVYFKRLQKEGKILAPLRENSSEAVKL